MAALINLTKVATKLSNKSSLGAIVAVRSHWNKDFKPSKFPETQKEREIAAKKYGIPVEEYKPYSDDGMGYGDYPKLSDEPVERRDAYYAWDYPEHKRNFNDPIHANIDMISEDRFGTAAPLRYSIPLQYATFLGVMTFCFVLYFWLEDKKMFRPVLPKQLAHDGKPHYTFESK
ncbi:unnamed protein product [Diamesa serratosioi]